MITLKNKKNRVKVSTLSGSSSSEEFKQVSSLLNFAHPTSFVLEIPFTIPNYLQQVGYTDTNRFALNIIDFTINRMSLTANTVEKSDYTLIYPSGSETTDKIVNVSYKLSEEFQQYAVLLNMWQKNLNVADHVVGEDDADDDDYELYTIKLWVLNSYKTPCMKITYEDCWINELGELQMSYQDSSPTLTHSFSFYYNDFEIEYLNERLNNL